MEYISSIFDYSIRSNTHGQSTHVQDIITYSEFSVVSINGTSKLCLLLSYERGFEVWDLSTPALPVLQFSIRNSGVKKIVYTDSQPVGSLILISLYQSTEFPKDTFQVFSISDGRVVESIKASRDIEDIVAKGEYVACALIDYAIEVFLKYERVYSVSPGGGIPEGYHIVIAICDLYLAYSLGSGKDTAISWTYSTIFSMIGVSSLMAEPRTHTQISILNLVSNVKLQEIHAFPTSPSKLLFTPSGSLLIVCPEHGQGFHIYRKNEDFQLIYKLHRGVSNAEIVHVSVSLNENWVTVTSSKGTSHLYSIEKNSKSLVYDHLALKRIRHYGTICCFVLEEFPPAVVTMSVNGSLRLKRLNSDRKLAKLSRNIDFKAKAFDLQDWENDLEQL